jgi:hypothetical protein
MPDLPPPSDFAASLKGDPILAWEIEIRRILDGERDHVIRRLGSLREYIQESFRVSGDRALAESTFKVALRQLAQEWQPLPMDPPRQTAKMLDLLQAYVPRGAESRLIGYMKKWGRFASKPVAPPPATFSQDLHLKAMAVLEVYFPSAPLDWRAEANIFSEYVDLLEADMGHPVYCGYAAARLIRLGIYKPQQDSIRQLLERYPAALQDLIAALLRPPSRTQSAGALSAIYEHCLTIGGEMPHQFEDHVAALGGEFDLKETSIHYRGDRVLLKLSDQTARLHAVARWDRVQHFKSIENALGAALPEAERQLTEIYEQCIQLGYDIPYKFEQYLHKHGARLHDTENGSPIISYRGHCIPLHLSPTALEYYTVLVRWAGAKIKIDSLYQRAQNATTV